MNKSLKLILLVMQIGGGLLGLGLIGRSIRTEQLTQTAVIIHIVFIFIFLFGIVAGVELVRKPKLGLWLSIVFQAMQIPVVTGFAVSYALVSGACFNLYRNATGYGFNFLFGSRYYLSSQTSESWIVGVNVYALILFLLLLREIRFEAVVTRICKPKPNKANHSRQFVQANNNQTSGSPLRHILH